ncbi:MAG: two-component system, LuxR family, sensor kinase FixL [Candidatus Binatota bacterium]|nr:two-component system, LuxR family, sensor kinase FixL [Candidatus Binatota bacterium]
MPLAAQAQYQAIFDNALEAIAVIDINGAIVSANRAMEQVFGYAPGEVIGNNVGMLLPEPAPSGRRARKASYGPAGLRAIAGIGREVDGRRKDGSVFPLDLSVAEWQRDGETFFTGIMRDVSRRRDAESALADGRVQLANLYRQSGAGLAETDAAGRFVSVNDRYCEIVGRSREALLQLRLHDIAHPEDHQQNLPLFTRLVTAGGPHSIEERYVRGDGSIVWVTKTASPIRIEDGKPIGLLVAIDVTERRLAEAALRESEEQLRLLQNDFAHLARVNDLGEMAAAIAHEINQPLTAIVNFLHAGAMSVATESTAEALAAARQAMALAAEQGLRAGAIVRGLREFVTKGDGGRLPQRADALVEAAMALALLDIRGTGIRLEHERAGDAMVEVDPVQIQQVLVNLLRNAVDALVTNPPGLPRHLTIVVRDLASEGVVEFCVADTGPGIPLEICDRLFDPFVTSKPKGMGMGLSVCQRIVQAHGGTIEVDCGDGAGATFRVRLPRHK